MMIIQVDLENFKSYEDESVLFTPGTNAISGKNGAGKSSILESIGFALFGYAPYTQDQLVREGEKTATVTVHVAGKDERIYQIVRKCGSYSQQYVYDPELEEKIVDGVHDTESWLKEFLGLEPGDDLSSLFQDAVGVQQGRLTSVFLETASIRKSTFNPLLGVDEYENAWSKLRESLRHLDDRIQDQETQIAGFEGELKALPGLNQEKEEFQNNLTQVEKELEEKEADLDNATEKKDALERFKQELDEKKSTLVKMEAEVDKAATNLSNAEEALKESKKAQEVVAEVEAGHEAYLENQRILSGLEEKRKIRDELKDNLSKHRSDLRLLEQRLEQEQKKLTEIKEAEEELEAIKPQVKLEDDLQEKLSQIEKEISIKEREVEEYQQIQAEIDDLQDKQENLQREIEVKKQKEKSLEEKRIEKKKLQENLDQLVKKIAETKAAREQVEAKITALGEESAVCPVCEEPLTEEHRAELTAKYDDQVDDLEDHLGRMRKEEQDLKESILQKDKELKKIEDVIKDLPREKELKEVEAALADKRKNLEELADAGNELKEAEKQKEALSQQLNELDEPGSRKAQLAAAIAGKDEIVETVVRLGNEIKEEKQAVHELDEQLKEHQSLDEELTAAREEVEANKADHNKYLENSRLAESLPKREEQVQELKETLRTLSEKLAETKENFAELEEGYDPEEYKELVGIFNALQKEVSAKKENRKHLTRSLEKAEKEIQRLAVVQKEMREAEEKQEEFEALRDLLSFLRNTLREAGPEITKRLVGLISMEAENFYREMMQDYSSRLQWTDDYDIQLITDGRTRHFPQLSGGEGMAAALAVRLALLREISGFDIAFFDEPTANLDEQRRENLSEQIMNVKGFSQIFVISHDDTFEKDTDNMIRIVKENNLSRVEV